jgi:hypothetical protein
MILNLAPAASAVEVASPLLGPRQNRLIRLVFDRLNGLMAPFFQESRHAVLAAERNAGHVESLQEVLRIAV